MSHASTRKQRSNQIRARPRSLQCNKRIRTANPPFVCMLFAWLACCKSRQNLDNGDMFHHLHDEGSVDTKSQARRYAGRRIICTGDTTRGWSLTALDLRDGKAQSRTRRETPHNVFGFIPSGVKIPQTSKILSCFQAAVDIQCRCRASEHTAEKTNRDLPSFGFCAGKATPRVCG
jgi:hypothetical protein